MIANRRFQIGVGLMVAGMFILPGCLKRKETIKVHRDGAVEFRIELEGDPGDFASGDALPTKRTGFKTRDWTTTDKNDKETQHRVATLRTAPGRPLPDSFAPEDDPNRATALAFPTDVTIERRKDGTYYHFRRVYERREQARYKYYEKMLEMQDTLEEIKGKDFAELTDEQARKVVTILRALEAFKLVEYLNAGVEALADEWPQHYGLLLRKDVLGVFEQAEIDSLLELMRRPQSPERDASIDDYGRQLVGEARERMLATLRARGVSRKQIGAFEDAYAEEQARRAVTEDLGDEDWVVRVKLPGEIVAHNGIKLEDGHVVWEFPGEALMDRDVVLMVTSRLGRGRTAPNRGN